MNRVEREGLSNINRGLPQNHKRAQETVLYLLTHGIHYPRTP